MKAFDVRAYSISDFQEWYADGKLELSPKFQRRSVWSSSAKDFLADTILRGKPFPKIILMQEFKEGRTIRVVVDGQQRLRSIFDFLSDGIKISRAHNIEYAGRVFSQLPEEMRNEFLQYEIGCDILNEAPLSELLDIFARINRYTVKLNAQELRNAQFSGFFKTQAFKLGYQYLDYWLAAEILSESQVTRMGEAELASDLLGSFMGAIQSSKAIEANYRNFEETEGNLPSAVSRLEAAITLSSAIYPETEVQETAWSSKHMYYSLVTCIGHIKNKFENVRATSIQSTSPVEIEKFRSILNGISSDYQTYSPQPKRAQAPATLKEFIRVSTLATTDTQARIKRIEYMLDVLEDYF